MIRLIILDFDGTIADTSRIIIDTIQATLRELGLPFRTREQCASRIGLPLHEVFSTLVPLDDAMTAACAATYRRLFAENNVAGAVSAFPNVIETIKALKARGVLLSIATSRSRGTLTQFLRDMGVLECFSYIVCAEDVVHAKPDPEPVLKTLRALQVAADEALVVGDAPYDIMMGNRAGTKTCAVTYGNGTVEELMAAKPDWMIKEESGERREEGEYQRTVGRFEV